MKDLYCLMHIYEDERNELQDKILGYFLTRDEAENNIENYKSLVGFRDYPNCFSVEILKIGRLYWEEGFIVD